MTGADRLRELPGVTVMLRVSMPAGAVLPAHPGAALGLAGNGYHVAVEGVPADQDRYLTGIETVRRCFERRTVHGLEGAGWRIPWRDLAAVPDGGILHLAAR